MKCYFCQNELIPITEQIMTCRTCFNCTKDDYQVMTCGNNTAQSYAHIFIAGYHIRLNLQENTTDIIHLVDSYAKYNSKNQIIIHIPNLNINLSNMKRKLKTYLLFL